MTVATLDPAKIPSGVDANNAANVANLQRRIAQLESSGGFLGANTINGTTGVIQGSITTPSIAAGSITASLISVSSLDALTATMGNLNVNGQLTIGGAGKIRTAAIGGSFAYTEFSAAGVRAQDAGGTTTFNLDSSTGIVTAKMVIQTGTQMPLGFIGGANLLSNSSCERPDFALTPWVPVNGATVTRSTNQAWHGLASFKVDGSAANVGIGHPTLPAKALKSYVLSAWVFPTVAAPFSLLVYPYDSTPAILTSFTYNGPTLPVNQWSRIAFTFLTPANTAYLASYVYASGTGTVTYYVDGVQLEPGEIATAYAPRGDEVLPGSITVNEMAANSISTAQLQAGAVITASLAAGAVTAAKFSGVIAGGNLISTATTSFEQNANGWLSGSNPGLNAGAVGAWSTAIAYYGAGCMSCVTDGTQNAQGVSTGQIPGPWRLGEKYTVSVYLYPGATMQFDLGLYDETTGEYTFTTNTVTVGKWNRITHTWSPSATRSTVRILVRTTTSTVLTFYIDAAQLEQGDVATAWKQYIAPATIEGSTITGALIQTAPAGVNPRVAIDSTNGLILTDPSGNVVTRIKGGGGGLDLAAATSLVEVTERQIRWLDGSNNVRSRLSGLTSGTQSNGVLTSFSSTGTFECNIGVTSSSVSCLAFVKTPSIGSKTILNDAGQSNFLQLPTAGKSTCFSANYATPAAGTGAQFSVTVNHGLGATPVGGRASVIPGGALVSAVFVEGITAWTSTTMTVTLRNNAGFALGASNVSLSVMAWT